MEQRDREGQGEKRKLQISKKKNAVTFVGYLSGESVFCLRTRNGGSKKCVLKGNICTIDDYKSYRLTEPQVLRFEEAKAQFDKDFLAAQRSEKNFLCAEKDGETRYVRRLSDWTYQIIAKSRNGDVRQKKGTVFSYLNDWWDLSLILPAYWKGFDARMQAEIEYRRKEKALLLSAGDEFLSCEVKYLNDEASREEVDFLVCSDGKARFIREKEIYGTEDVKLLEAQRIPRTYFSRSLKYWITVEIDGKLFRALYYWNSARLSVVGESKSSNVPITEELQENIRVFTCGGKVEKN